MVMALTMQTEYLCECMMQEYDFRRDTLSAGASDTEVAVTPIPFQMFKLLVDAGADLNATSKSMGNILFKLLVEPCQNEAMAESDTWLCVVMATRYLLLESPRRCEVDLQSILRTQHTNESLVATAIQSPVLELRRIVLRAAAERESTSPGSGDPDNFLQLRPESGNIATSFSAIFGRRTFIPRSDPPIPNGGMH